MRGLILSSAIDPVLHSVRVKVQGLSGQFRMILICKRAQATSSKQQALDKRLKVWDNMIIINKRITHDKTRNTSRKIRRFRNEAQEPARLRLWDDPAAARAGRPVGRGAGMHHQLARSLKLRDLYAAVPGTDGREASSGGWRNGCYHSDQGTKVHGPQEEVQGSGLINRGLRAPSTWKQGSGIKRQATSVKRQAASFR